MNQNTSTTAASAIILQARYKLGIATTDAFFPDAQMLAWVNEGQRTIAQLTHCLQNTETIALIASTLEYSIVSTVYFDIDQVHYIDASGVHHRMEEAESFNPLESQGAGVPDLWYEHAGKIAAYPTLATVTTESIKLYFPYLPTDVAAVGNNIVIPKAYDMELVEFVYLKGLQKDRDPAYETMMSDLVKKLSLYRSETAAAAPDIRKGDQ